MDALVLAFCKVTSPKTDYYALSYQNVFLTKQYFNFRKCNFPFLEFLSRLKYRKIIKINLKKVRKS